MAPNTISAQDLRELIAEAVMYHPSVLSSQSRMQSSDTEIDTARWQFFPTPSISMEAVDANQADPSYAGDDYVAVARLNQPLWTGGRLTAGIKKAKANFAASQASYDEARQDIALRVVQAYGDWLSATLQHNAWQTSLDTHVRLHHQVQRRVAEGVSSNSDLELAEGRLATTRAELAAVSARETVALSQLNQLVGRRLYSGLLDSQQPALPNLAADLNKLLAHATAISPGINLAKAQLRIADAEMVETKADRWPEIYLRLEYQDGNFNLPDASSETRVFVGFDSRFGAGLSTLTRAKTSRYSRQAAEADIQTQLLAIQEQIRTDYALAKSFDQRIQALQASLQTAQNVSESYGRQFLAGRKSWLDVMNTARDLVSTQVQLADAEASQLTVSWRLAVITQGAQSL